MANRPGNLKILQVNTLDIIGGAAGSVWNRFEAYRQRGHKSWLAVGYKYGNDPDVFEILHHPYRSGWARMWLALGAPVWAYRGKLPGVWRFHNLLRWFGEPHHWMERERGIDDFHFPGTSHLLKLTPEIPDIVHCNNLHGDYFDLRILPWLSHQVPLILNLHDAWLVSGHCAHSFDCERWKIGCGHCPDLTIPPAIKRDATAYNWQRKRDIYKQSRLYITAPSQWLMDKVRSSMLCGVQYRVIPNAINLAIFRPGSQAEARKTLNLPETAKIVLLIAHNSFKDYETMESALGKLNKLKGHELMFICLGKTGDPKLVGHGQLFYPGLEKDPQRLACYYQAADVFIHAAKDEAFGKTITEALACGIPVVATAVGGIPEQIQHGKTGFLVPPKDSDAMASAIDSFLADRGLCKSIGEAAASDASHRFGLEREVNDFLNWYQEILEDWKQPLEVQAKNL